MTTYLHQTSLNRSQRKRFSTNSFNRKGNILAGCLIALGIAVVLAIVATIFVMNSWRGWVSGGITQGLTAVLEETPIDVAERTDILAHIENLMVRFENKEVSLEDLALVIEELSESPLVPTALVMSADSIYILNSDLDEEQKAQAHNELARFAQGLYEESIDPARFHEVLGPIQTSTPDDNDIVLNIQYGANGQMTNALRSADEVTTEELLEVIELARLAADEAEVTQTPRDVDLSNEVGLAIANALGEDPMLWLPEGTELPTADEPETDDAVEEDDTVEDTDGSEEDTDPNDGP
jgi:hypothetical protein